MVWYSHLLKMGISWSRRSLGRKVMTNLYSILKNRDITLPIKVHLVKAMVFPVVMYGCELDHKESWVQKNWCFWTEVLEKTLESPLECKEIKTVNSEGNQSWIFIGWTDAEAETPILWPPDVNNWLLGKDPNAGKDWRQKKGMTEDNMVGWLHPTQWTWVWASWWWTGKPGVLQSMGLQRVRHHWATELTDGLTQRTMIFTDSQNEPGSQMTLELMNELIKTTLPADF